MVSDIRQTDRHTAEPLVPEPSAFDVELVIGKINSHKLSGIDKIPAEVINPLNPELNPICYLLALLGAQHILHVSGIRVNGAK